MTVYVDPMMPCPVTQMWKWAKSSHLYADRLGELHAFAARLGLKHSWFQRESRCPHYDLTENKRRLAVQQGAIEHTIQQAVAKWAELYPRKERA